jgi:hypothetical protein
MLLYQEHMGTGYPRSKTYRGQAWIASWHAHENNLSACHYSFLADFGATPLSGF